MFNFFVASIFGIVADIVMIFRGRSAIESKQMSNSLKRQLVTGVKGIEGHKAVTAGYIFVNAGYAATGLCSLIFVILVLVAIGSAFRSLGTDKDRRVSSQPFGDTDSRTHQRINTKNGVVSFEYRPWVISGQTIKARLKEEVTPPEFTLVKPNGEEFTVNVDDLYESDKQHLKTIANMIKSSRDRRSSRFPSNSPPGFPPNAPPGFPSNRVVRLPANAFTAKGRQAGQFPDSIAGFAHKPLADSGDIRHDGRFEFTNGSR